MSQQPEATEAVLDIQRPASTLRNLVFAVMVFAGLGVAGEGWAVVREVYRNLGGNVLAWLVCGLLVLIGVIIIWRSYVQALTWRDVLTRSPRKGELGAMIALTIVAGAIGGALGSNLDWRLHWTAGAFVEGTAREWEKTQGLLGWLLALVAVVGVWTILTQLRKNNAVNQQG